LQKEVVATLREDSFRETPLFGCLFPADQAGKRGWERVSGEYAFLIMDYFVIAKRRMRNVELKIRNPHLPMGLLGGQAQSEF
jgi:hypothetical protein